MNYQDYIIVGAGPGGLQMGYFLQKAKRDYLILEAHDHPGSFFSVHPRHQTLISLNKRFNWFPEPEFNLRHDWNSLLSDNYSVRFGDYTDELYPQAEAMVRYLADYTEKYNLNVRYNTRIVQIDRAEQDARHFILTDEQGEQYTCARLLMATGPTRPMIPEDIEGIELVDGYEDHDLDPRKYENKRLLIMGRGNSAFEVANHLAGHAAIIHLSVGKPIKHAWHTHTVSDLRAINNTIIDMYQLKALHATLGFWVKKIRQNPDGTFSVDTVQDVPHWKIPGTIKSTLTYDHIIRCTGWKYTNQALFTSTVSPEVDEKDKYPILNNRWESTVPDLFYIGTAMAGRDRRTTSGVIHGFRYNIQTLFRLLEERYDNVPLPAKKFSLKNVEDLRSLSDILVERISTTSALFPLFGFLCDTLIFTEGEVEIVYELPKDYVLETHRFTEGKEIILLTLEFGFHNYAVNANLLDFIHPADEATDTACAAFLHPVFRHYANGSLMDETHLTESLVVRYGSYRGEYAQELKNDLTNNTIMNIINKVGQVTDERFSEEVLQVTENGRSGFEPWPLERRMEEHVFSPCLINDEDIGARQ